jgi:transporter family protein
VFPVLLGTISRGFLFVAIFYGLAIFYPDYALENGYNFQQFSWKIHGFIFIKSAIMAASWILAYQALKHLPITIVTPIRSAGPFFTLIGAIVIYKESPN